ncbi:MAG: pantoate--beta-alanine ligase, partial [Pseudomonadota bacterium]
VASIFVNPTQFGAGEDLDSYPRDRQRDVALLAEAGCHLVFAPAVEEMYPPGFATSVSVSGITDVLCGAARPGHFDGVAQVVSKLLNQAQADVAVFGEKDWQQLAVIRRMASDLDIPTSILGAPIVREPDGLAMSSRNRYLSDDERRAAPVLYQSLRTAAEALQNGAAIGATLSKAGMTVETAGFGPVDYIDLREGATLTPISDLAEATAPRLFAAAHLGKARLIDNIAVLDGS